MDEGLFRPLRPALQLHKSVLGVSAPGPVFPAPAPPANGDPAVRPKPKSRSRALHKTKAACNWCRLKKSGCDGNRPVCSTCHRRKQPCVYSTNDPSQTPSMALKQNYSALKAELDDLHGLLDSLRLSSEDTAQAILQRLRTSGDVPVVLNQFRSFSVLPRLSEQDLARAHLPPTHSGKELELLARHPAAYPTLDPAVDRVLTKGLPEAFAGDQPREVAVTTGPQLKDKYCDPRLALLKIKFWSTVPVSDEYAASVISFYLETDHAIYGLFDADLFVADLIGGQMRFCSAFLVNCLLAFTLHAYTSRDPTAPAKSLEFERAAESIWLAEKSTDSITAVGALMLLYNAIGSRGQAEMGSVYIHEASRMATRMRLFGIRDSLDLQQMSLHSPDEIQATAHTAWGVFGCIAMQSIFYIVPPPEYPPALPIPERLADRMAEGGEGPSPPNILSYELHGSFMNLCRFWAIASEALTLYHHKNGPEAVPPAFALSSYHKLLALGDALPPSLRSGEDNLPQTTAFHIFYHMIILEIFRPFLSTKPAHDRDVWSLASLHPDTVFRASVAQLKRLVLRYSRRLLPSCFSILWHIGMMTLVNAVLMDIADQSWQFYFKLCMVTYGDLFPAFPVSEAIAQGLLMMAINTRGITELEAQKMIQSIRARGGGRTAPVEPTRGFVVDLDLAATDHDAALVSNLVTRFEETTAVAEFIDMNMLNSATEL